MFQFQPGSIKRGLGGETCLVIYASFNSSLVRLKV